jgi:hypothetical protein
MITLLDPRTTRPCPLTTDATDVEERATGGSHALKTKLRNQPNTPMKHTTINDPNMGTDGFGYMAMGQDGHDDGDGDDQSPTNATTSDQRPTNTNFNGYSIFNPRG